jgi:hypothetical protein
MSRTETTTSSKSEPKTEPSKGLDLSVTQVVGGALAAMTAAALGSRLSVAGTVTGAALASIIAAIAGALYTASLRRTRDKVRSVWTGTTGGTSTRVEVVSEAPAAGPTETVRPLVEAPSTKDSIWRSGRLWKRIVIGALATFALAAGLVTGLELVSGQALSGGSGTTLEQVREPRTGGSDADEREPSESPSAEASDESTQPSEEPSESTDSSPDTTTEPSAGDTTEEPAPSTEATEEPNSNAESAPAEGEQSQPAGDAPQADGNANGNADAGGAE